MRKPQEAQWQIELPRWQERSNRSPKTMQESQHCRWVLPCRGHQCHSTAWLQLTTCQKLLNNQLHHTSCRATAPPITDDCRMPAEFDNTKASSHQESNKQRPIPLHAISAAASHQKPETIAIATQLSPLQRHGRHSRHATPGPDSSTTRHIHPPRSPLGCGECSTTRFWHALS
jgi:hypothetical protein